MARQLDYDCLPEHRVDRGLNRNSMDPGISRVRESFTLCRKNHGKPLCYAASEPLDQLKPNPGIALGAVGLRALGFSAKGD